RAARWRLWPQFVSLRGLWPKSNCRTQTSQCLHGAFSDAARRTFEPCRNGLVRALGGLDRDHAQQFRVCAAWKCGEFRREPGPLPLLGSRRRGGFLVLQQRQFDRRGRRSGGIVLLDKCTGQGQGCFTAKPGRTSIAFAAKARLSVNYPRAREIE